MKLFLCDKQAEIINLCSDIDGLEVAIGDIFEHPFDAVMTPGNSYAFMGGGFDLAVSNAYGWDVQKSLQETWIKNCEIIPMGGAVGHWTNNNKLIVYAPVANVPMNLNNTWNVYLAMKAGLEYAKSCNIKKVAFPAFGCGSGGLNKLVFKKQLKAAINDYNTMRRFNNWQEAQSYYFDLIEV